MSIKNTTSKKEASILALESKNEALNSLIYECWDCRASFKARPNDTNEYCLSCIQADLNLKKVVGK